MNHNELLKKIVRFEMDVKNYVNEDYEYDQELYDGTYQPTYQDLVVACQNMMKEKIDLEIWENWYDFVVYDLEECYEDVWTLPENYEYLWPVTEEDLLYAIVFAFERIIVEKYEMNSKDLYEVLKDILKMVEDFENKDEKSQIKLTERQKKWILVVFDEQTEFIPKEKVELFRQIVDEECEKGDILAMEIKGYGCYSGNNVYKNDWEEARKWITKLFETTGEPSYANSLGYIYYYGRCNDGIPEYDKAFQYFSIGAAYDLYESTYKLADMFMRGNGCIKSPDTAKHIYRKLYLDSRPRFCMGEDAKFADLALRLAGIYEREEAYEKALRFYLEADFAIKKRMEFSDFWGDKKVQDSIERGLQNVIEKIETGFFKDEVITKKPNWLFDVFSNRNKYKTRITQLGEYHYKVSMKCDWEEYGAMALVVIPEMKFADFLRGIEFEVETKKIIEHYDCKPIVLNVDGVEEFFGEEYTFSNDGEELFTIQNAKYHLRRDGLID